MRPVITIIIMLCVSAAAVGDALSTGVFLLKKGEYDALVKKEGDIRKVKTDLLWDKIITNIKYISDLKECHEVFSIKIEKKNYRLYVTRLKNKKVMYGMIDVSDSKKEILVSAGTISVGEEVKKDISDEPFVVVFRTDNFEEQ